MVIIGLLLIALICLALGLITQSAVWLVASLIATGGAAYLLYKLRDVIAAPKDAPPTTGFLLPELPEEIAKAAVVPRAVGTRAHDEPDRDADASSATDPQDEVTVASDADEVWVIDGRPRFHLGDCAIIKGQDAEPIPYDQATEDGFMPCSLCEPHAVAYPPMCPSISPTRKLGGISPASGRCPHAPPAPPARPRRGGGLFAQALIAWRSPLRLRRAG